MKFSLPLSLTAVAAALAACTTPEAITSMRHVDQVVYQQPSAATGGSAPLAIAPSHGLPGGGRVETLSAAQRDGGSVWRATVLMDDGSTRVVDTLTDGIMVGKRVYVDADGRLSLQDRGPVVATPPATPPLAVVGNTVAPAYESRWVNPRAGAGRVETLAVVPNNAGFRAANGEEIYSVWRIGVRMDDGTLQTMDSPSSGLSVGKRVRITNEGNIVGAES